MRHFSFILLFLCLACTKKDKGNCTLGCSTEGVTATFSGYQPFETDTIYLNTYVFNHKFDTLKKQELLSETDTFTLLGKQVMGRLFLSPRTDYEIVIPATAQTFRISMKDTVTVDTFMCDNMPKGAVIKTLWVHQLPVAL